VFRTEKGQGSRLVGIAVPVAIGVLIAGLLFMSASAGFLVPGGGTPAVAPPFQFLLNETGTHYGSGVYEYNLSTVSINNESLTLSWIQFNVVALTASQIINITVQVTEQSGGVVGIYNSTDSQWEGPATQSNATFTSFGGWTTGGTLDFNSTYDFHVMSTVSLSGRDLDVGMQLDTSPHSTEIQTLSL